MTRGSSWVNRRTDSGVTHAFRYTPGSQLGNGVTVDLNTLVVEWIDLADPGTEPVGWYAARAMAVNEDGQIVGSAFRSAPFVSCASRFHPTGVIWLLPPLGNDLHEVRISTTWETSLDTTGMMVRSRVSCSRLRARYCDCARIWAHQGTGGPTSMMLAKSSCIVTFTVSWQGTRQARAGRQAAGRHSPASWTTSISTTVVRLSGALYGTKNPKDYACRVSAGSITKIYESSAVDSAAGINDYGDIILGGYGYRAFLYRWDLGVSVPLD